jgi:hypothetical protein
MPAHVCLLFAQMDWAVLVIPAVGILAAALVHSVVTLAGRLRRKTQPAGSKEEDLSWADLLELLRQKKGGQCIDLPDDASLADLLTMLPAPARRAAETPAQDPEMELLPTGERRSGRRRWGNPIEVQISSPLWPGYVCGLVVNRSTGGVAVVLDREIPAGTEIGLRSVEAPYYLPAVEATVRHCRKAGKLFLIGCEFVGEVPWNVRVWFG